jgi:hypothetical protein
MDCLPQCYVTPKLMMDVAAFAVLREQHVGGPVQVEWIPAR